MWVQPSEEPAKSWCVVRQPSHGMGGLCERAAQSALSGRVVKYSRGKMIVLEAQRHLPGLKSCSSLSQL